MHSNFQTNCLDCPAYGLCLATADDFAAMEGKAAEAGHKYEAGQIFCYGPGQTQQCRADIQPPSFVNDEHQRYLPGFPGEVMTDDLAWLSGVHAALVQQHIARGNPRLHEKSFMPPGLRWMGLVIEVDDPLQNA